MRKIAILGVAFAAWLVTDVVASPIISNPVNYRTNRSANPVGLPSGDREVIGASSVVPSAGTTVTAERGSETLTLLALPYTLIPDAFVNSIPFVSGDAWTLHATNGGTTDVTTNSIPTPELIPLVTNLQVGGAGSATPLITWACRISAGSASILSVS